MDCTSDRCSLCNHLISGLENSNTEEPVPVPLCLWDHRTWNRARALTRLCSEKLRYPTCLCQFRPGGLRTRDVAHVHNISMPFPCRSSLGDAKSTTRFYLARASCKNDSWFVSSQVLMWFFALFGSSLEKWDWYGSNDPLKMCVSLFLRHWVENYWRPVDVPLFLKADLYLLSTVFRTLNAFKLCLLYPRWKKTTKANECCQKSENTSACKISRKRSGSIQREAKTANVHSSWVEQNQQHVTMTALGMKHQVSLYGITFACWERKWDSFKQNTA